MADPVSDYDGVIATPLGPIGLQTRDGVLVGLAFLPDETPDKPPADAPARQAAARIMAYFADPRQPIEVPVKLQGTDFQQRVWQVLRRIPVGSVLTYGDVAKRLHTAPRAVGGACRANPCPLLVPCHRVVAAHGRGGYAGATSGRWMRIKERLLRHEGVHWPV